jgi:AsmA protein
MLNGAGTLPANVKKNLVGDGNFSIKNGKITNSKIPDKLALFLGIPELRTIKLKKAHGTIIIRNSIARLESIFSSDDISMDPSGNIGLDETLDLAFDLKLSPRLTDKVTLKSNLSSFIKDEKGWGNVPLKVSGAFVDPSYSVDVAKAGKRVIEKKGKRLLENLFKKEDDKKSEKDIKKEDKKPVQDLFKGLFK